MNPRSQQFYSIMARGGLRRGRAIAPEGFGITPEELSRPVTSASLFGNDAPLELEVGSGKGTFLVTESQARPDVNFLGIEYTRRYWRCAADRLRRNDQDNARLVLAEAVTFIRDHLDDASLSGVHVYFPDPWPKTSHRKRRFVQAEHIELVAMKMRSGARLRIVTDHAKYFAQIDKVIRSSSLRVIDFDALAAAADSQEIVGSNFERKYRREGRAFHTIACERV